MNKQQLPRRDFLKWISATGLSLVTSPLCLPAQSSEDDDKPKEKKMATRTIPSTSEDLPVVGVGTWKQFDVPSRKKHLRRLRTVLNKLFETGGSVIDSSPMYGRAEGVVGKLLKAADDRDRAFLATKVWTRGRKRGIKQMKESLEKLNADTIDLMQVHNLKDWRTHLNTLKKWKKKGTIRYTGVTHYLKSKFDRIVRIMKNRDIDFVQIPFSIGMRAATEKVFPVAEDQDVGVIVNRPFRGGQLFRTVRRKNLPEWVGKLKIQTWAQYFLKFILSHSAVTCVIPGTSNPGHMKQNALAGVKPFPDKKQRKKMIKYWQQ